MEDPLRARAEEYLRHGFGGIAAAFDLAKERDWMFAPEVRERATELLSELMGLFQDSELRQAAPSQPALAEKLRARYPGVDVAEAYLRANCDGELQQSIRYRAPLALLMEYGLLTQKMYNTQSRVDSCTPIGDGFFLTTAFDGETKSKDSDLWIYTEQAPRERKRVSIRDAQRELKRIAKGAALKQRT